MRIDKFIWCVRLAKTRSLATKLCQGNKVLLNNNEIKPSKEVQLNDEIAIKTGPIWKTFKILDIPKSRVGAKLLAELIIETTSEAELEKLELFQLNQRVNKNLGLKGRPTKKNRRDLESFND